MRGVLASLLIPSLMATAGVLPSLHAHVYRDHDHPEHHRGLSAHEHHAAPVHAHDESLRWVSCDPGKHVISFVFVGSPPPQMHVAAAELGPTPLPAPELRMQPAVDRVDARVHGPPPRTQPSPRAPPSIVHA